ncbi:hypothetical protein [Pantoea agglomerans]|uniref:hypothetical protein n=1 Tax=Enterobacter agglomerans TaxID=549 RepID=UPI002413BCB1|nr:hypothetical protein [Pantoea agglomerans]
MIINLPVRSNYFTRKDVEGMCNTPADAVNPSKIVALCTHAGGVAAVLCHERGIPTKAVCLRIGPHIAFDKEAKLEIVRELEGELAKLQSTPREEESLFHWDQVNELQEELINCRALIEVTNDIPVIYS